MITIPSDLNTLLRSANAYAFSAPDKELADKLQNLQASQAERLFSYMELLYAFHDRLDDAGLVVLGQLSGYCHANGWRDPGDEARYDAIYQGVLRDTGAPGAYATVVDPEPKASLREDVTDWRLARDAEPNVARRKVQLISAIKAVRADKEVADVPVTIGGVDYEAQADPESKLKINGLTTLALAAKLTGKPFQVGYIMADNRVPVLTADDAISFGSQVAMRVSAIYARSVELRAEIEAAQTMADLDAIDLQANWP